MVSTKPNVVLIQEKGQVTIPIEIRERFGLREGDEVSVEATSEGVLLVPKGVLALRALSEIGDALKDQGIALEELIDTSEDIREELYHEWYGHLESNSS